MTRKVKNGRAEPRYEEKPVTTPAKRNGAGERKTRWANADIRPSEHKKAIRELSGNADYVLDTIVELVDAGYDIHIARADEGATVRTMLFCRIPNHINENGGLSANAPDAWLSITSVVYKHIHILEGKWFDETAAGEENDNWR